eukprot:6157735-Prorocentrum_lima.AAC.1
MFCEFAVEDDVEGVEERSDGNGKKTLDLWWVRVLVGGGAKCWRGQSGGGAGECYEAVGWCGVGM